MSLEAKIRVPSRGVDASLAVSAGGALALLGANGSGKTTVLEVLAGLVRPASGFVRLGGRVLMDDDTWVPAARRRVALVSQDTALFPAMSVLDNVGFGVRAGGAKRADARAEAEGWLARVGAEQLASRRPRDLSGGEARRVAIARALAVSPAMLLLDEPFSGLDIESATSIRALVSDVASTVTTVIATHDAIDVHLLADRVAILVDGRVEQDGNAADVMARPRTAFAARMASRVLVTGTLGPRGITTDGGTLVLARTRGLTRGARGAIAVAPARVSLGVDGVPQPVTAMEPRGDIVRVHGPDLAADIEPAVAATLRRGDVVHMQLPTDATAYAL